MKPAFPEAAESLVQPASQPVITPEPSSLVAGEPPVRPQPQPPVLPSYWGYPYPYYYQGQRPVINQPPPVYIQAPPGRTKRWVILLVSITGLLLVAALITVGLLIANLFGTGGPWPFDGPVTTEQSAVKLGSATRVKVDLNMGSGSLKLSGGASDLMNGTFQYSQPRFQPVVSYSEQDNNGQLSIRQPATTGLVFSYRHDWNLQLNNTVATDLTINTGIASSELRLAGLNLTRLEISNGVGKVTVDLTGLPARNLDVFLKGGVGNTTLVLPAEIGVKVTRSGGLGQVQASGYLQSGNIYTNQAYGHTATTILINLNQGVGDVILQNQGR